MDPGYLGDPARSKDSLGGAAGEAGQQAQQETQKEAGNQMHANVHALRASLSVSDAGSLSQQLQSTPRGWPKTTTSGQSGGLHRVYRTSSRPVTVSSSATGTESSVSLSSVGDEEEEESESEGVNNTTSAARQRRDSNDSTHGKSPASEYWRRIVLDIDNQETDLPPVMPRATSRLELPTLQTAPSTGSSTLVEQEVAGYNIPAYYEASSSLQGMPRSSSQSSRFAAAVSYAAELEQGQHNISGSSGSRSLTPQPPSFRDASYSYTHSDDDQSRVASKVHDIFQRHIHNASTSYSTRRSMSRSTSRDVSRTSQRPRQRLRDLLASSVEERDAAHRATDTPASHQQASHPEHRSYHTGESRHHASPSHASYDSEILQHTPASTFNTSRHSPRAAGTTRPSDESHISPVSRMPRQMSSVTPRAVESEALQHAQSLDQTSASHAADRESVNDGDIEDHQLEEGSIVRRKGRSSRTDTTSPMPPLIVSKETFPPEEASESDFSPVLADETSEEDDKVASETRSRGNTSHNELKYTSSRDRTRRVQSASPSSRSIDNTPSIPVSPSPRRILRQSHSLFQDRQQLNTPPKTPRFPGHYVSATPFIQDTASAKNNETIRLNTHSTFLGNATLATSLVPGGYVSPFPHPKQASAKLNPESETSSSDVAPLALQRKPDRFSMMLNRVIEEVAEEGNNPRSPHNMSPSRRGRGRHVSDEMQQDVIALHESSRTEIPARSDDEIPKTSTPEEQDHERSSTLASAEKTLQNLLVDLVKPLRGVVGGFSPPQTAAETVALHEDSETTMVSNQSFEQRLRDRKMRRSEQDAMLRQLQEADLRDHSLVHKAEELKLSLEDLGNRFTTQVTCVLNETFAQEQRRRQLWFLFLILAELFLVWGLFALANARANLLYQTTYYDPFSPELYDPNPSSYIGATYQPTSIPSTATNAHTILSRPFFGTLTTYIRTSSNSFTSLLPYYDGLASSVPLQDDTSVIAHRYTLPQEGVRTYVQQFVDIIKHLYRHLLLAGLGQNSFAHGTLGESISGSSGQLYRVPT